MVAAATNGHWNIVRTLAQCGASINWADQVSAA